MELVINREWKLICSKYGVKLLHGKSIFCKEVAVYPTIQDALIGYVYRSSVEDAAHMEIKDVLIAMDRQIQQLTRIIRELADSVQLARFAPMVVPSIPPPTVEQLQEKSDNGTPSVGFSNVFSSVSAPETPSVFQSYTYTQLPKAGFFAHPTDARSVVPDAVIGTVSTAEVQVEPEMDGDEMMPSMPKGMELRESTKPAKPLVIPAAVQPTPDDGPDEVDGTPAPARPVRKKFSLNNPQES